jgi:hypothetical protein
MIMTATAARTMTATRPKIMVETATATRRETAAENMKAVSPGPLTRTGAATVAAATTAKIITGDRPLLRK